MDTQASVLFVAALMLFFVISLSVLSAFSKMLAQNPKTAASRRSWEMGCLMVLAFVLIAAVLVWRST